MNQVILEGGILRIKSFPKIVKFTVVTTSKDGKYKEFINCMSFDSNIMTTVSNLQEGNIVKAVGSIKNGKYENKDGITVYTTDVNVFKLDVITESTAPSVDDISQAEGDDLPF